MLSAHATAHARTADTGRVYKGWTPAGVLFRSWTQGPTVSACAIGKVSGGESGTNDVSVRPVFTLIFIIYPYLFDLNPVRDHY